MNNDKFFNSLNSLLAEGRVARVISVLRDNCVNASKEHPDLLRLLPEIDGISDIYSRMREFLLKGLPDPDRSSLLDELYLRINDTARDYLFIINENRLDPFFAEYRLMKVRGRNLAEMMDELSKFDYRIEMAKVTEADTSQFIARKEDMMSRIFRAVWALPPWAAKDRETVRKYLQEPSAAFELKSQLVTALLLGILKFYDPGKFRLLIEAYENADDERIAARALTSIVIVLSRWGVSVLSVPEIKQSLERIADSILTYTRLRDVVMTLIRTRDTDRVSREVNEAMQTTMRHMDPEILDKLSKEGLSVDSGDIEMNPEWEKLMKNKELEEKMQMINDMQLEGLDVMMQTFSRLKSFPFFNCISNWFLPFSPSHSSVAHLFENFSSEAFEAMGNATDMCASDRYSFALGILQMPEERRSMLATHLGSQLESLQDFLKDKENVRRKPVFATESLVFARDLYRFAKLYPRKKDFFDPFDSPVNFLKLPVFGSLLSEDEIILAAADFYFEHGYYNLSLELYQAVADTGTSEKHLYEKIGFCRQMAGDMEGALATYEKADLFSSDADRSSTWLIKKLAFCNKALGRYKKAAEYYSRLLESCPDDLSAEYHLGSVLLRSGQLKEAMERLSKVHYIRPEHKGCARAYFRGMILRNQEGTYRDAYNAISQWIERGNRETADLTLMGHAAFLTGNLKEAEDLYREARGEKDPLPYRREIISEILSLNPETDIEGLRLLLDWD